MRDARYPRDSDQSPALRYRFGVLAGTIEALRSVALSSDDASGHFAAMYARVTDKVR